MPRVKSLGFCQEIIKQVQASALMMFAERKTMKGPEGIGGAVGAGVSIGPAVSSRLVTRAAPVSGSSFGERSAFGAALAVARPIINEGPVGRSFLEKSVPFSVKSTRPLRGNDMAVPDLGGIFKSATELKLTQPVKSFNRTGEIVFNPKRPSKVGSSLNKVDVLAEVEAVLFQDRVNKQNPLEKTQKRVEPEIKPVELPNWQAVIPKLKPKTAPIIVPIRVEYPKPKVVISPALEPAVQTGPQTRAGVATEVRQATATQPVLEEQEVEETVTERVTKEQIDTVKEEETEESRLKNVVDEKVLNTRIKEFGIAVDVVGAVAEAVSEDLDGGKIVKLVPAETRKSRSGLVKEQGPDGSRVETIEEVTSKKFKSVKEAKEQIVAIIARKVPVKRAKEGVVVGYEAVVRVLKYFFVKAKPVEQMITRVIKKQKVLAKEGQKPLQIVPAAKPEVKEQRIENLGLAEVFQQKAA